MPNGIVNAIVLPHTMRYNAPVTGARSTALLEALSGVPGATAEQSPGDRVASLLASLPVPRRLREIGITPEDIAPIAKAAMSDWFITRNARPVKEIESLKNVLDAAW